MLPPQENAVKPDESASHRTVSSTNLSASQSVSHSQSESHSQSKSESQISVRCTAGTLSQSSNQSVKDGQPGSAAGSESTSSAGKKRNRSNPPSQQGSHKHQSNHQPTSSNDGQANLNYSHNPFQQLGTKFKPRFNRRNFHYDRGYDRSYDRYYDYQPNYTNRSKFDGYGKPFNSGSNGYKPAHHSYYPDARFAGGKPHFGDQEQSFKVEASSFKVEASFTPADFEKLALTQNLSELETLELVRNKQRLNKKLDEQFEKKLELQQRQQLKELQYYEKIRQNTDKRPQFDGHQAVQLNAQLHSNIENNMNQLNEQPGEPLQRHQFKSQLPVDAHQLIRASAEHRPLEVHQINLQKHPSIVSLPAQEIVGQRIEARDHELMSNRFVKSKKDHPPNGHLCAVSPPLHQSGPFPVSGCNNAPNGFGGSAELPTDKAALNRSQNSLNRSANCNSFHNNSPPSNSFNGNSFHSKSLNRSNNNKQRKNGKFNKHPNAGPPRSTSTNYTSYGPSYPKLIQNDVLSSQIWKTYLLLRQTPESYQRKIELRQILYDVLRQQFENNLYIVGSSLNGLGTNTSDVDMCLLLPDRVGEIDQLSQAIPLLELVKRVIRDRPDLGFFDTENMKLIAAKIPILKFSDKQSKIEVDLNINNIVGIRNTQLIRCYTRLDWRVQPLAITIKAWAHRNNIKNAYQKTISSYTLVLMLIHYLQVGCSPPCLPCLHKLMPNNFHTDSDVTKLSLNEETPEYRSKNEQSLGELFIGFLDYYGNRFDYLHDVISIRQGSVMKKEVAKEYRSSKNTSTQWRFICCEEPFDRTNTARSVSDYESYKRIIGVFRESHARLQATQSLLNVLNLDHILGQSCRTAAGQHSFNSITSEMIASNSSSDLTQQNSSSQNSSQSSNHTNASRGSQEAA